MSSVSLVNSVLLVLFKLLWWRIIYVIDKKMRVHQLLIRLYIFLAAGAASHKLFHIVEKRITYNPPPPSHVHIIATNRQYSSKISSFFFLLCLLCFFPFILFFLFCLRHAFTIYFMCLNVEKDTLIVR